MRPPSNENPGALAGATGQIEEQASPPEIAPPLSAGKAATDSPDHPHTPRDHRLAALRVLAERLRGGLP